MLPTLRAMSSYARLVRFLTPSSSTPLIGEPVDSSLDVGVAAANKDPIEVDVFSGSSILSPGERTGKRETVGQLLSPLSQSEVGTIRCIGLNHAKEVNMAIPSVPTVFLKPETALAGPYPEPTVVPRAFVGDNAADYESELAVVIGKTAKDVSEAEAMDYVLGYTAANDISSREQQFATSQWCYSKSFDGACPIGPAFVAASQVTNISDLTIRGTLNDKVVQECPLSDLIFSVPQIVSFLSRGTTLRPGTVIITGTPAGVGWSQKPRIVLKDGDEFRVFLSGGIGTLVNKIVEEK